MRAHFSVYLLFLFGFISTSFASSHHPQEFLATIRGAKDEGAQIYQHFCVNCHAKNPKIPLGAPRIGEKSDWALRVKLGMDVLFKHTDEGINAMPPRGGCFECSDKQLELAIYEMIPKEALEGLLNTHGDHKKNK